MEIVKDYDEKKLTLSIDGRVDSITSKELHEEINNEIGNFDSLVIDFTYLEYISSAGLRVLISTQKKLTANDVPFVIKNTNDEVDKTFKMSGFDKILRIE